MSASAPSTIKGVKDRLQSLTDRLSDVEKRLDVVESGKEGKLRQIVAGLEFAGGVPAVESDLGP